MPYKIQMEKLAIKYSKGMIAAANFWPDADLLKVLFDHVPIALYNLTKSTFKMVQEINNKFRNALRMRM